MKRYTTGDIAALPHFTSPDRIQEIIDTGFQSLTALALVEASGNAPASAASVLEGAQNADRWLQALLHVRANLSSNMATHSLDLKPGEQRTDDRFRRLDKTRKAVSTRITSARRRSQSHRARRNMNLRSSLDTARSEDPAIESLILARPGEYHELVADEVAIAGISPAALDPPRDFRKDPRWAFQHGLLPRVLGEEVRHILRLGKIQFREAVAEDARTPGGAFPALRAAVVVKDWGEVLNDLLDTQFAKLKLGEACRAGIPDIIWLNQPQMFDDPMRAIGSLRFTEALVHRLGEQTGCMQELEVQIDCSHRQQERLVHSRAQTKLKKKFPDDYKMAVAITA